MTTQPISQQNTAAYISGFEDGKRVNAAELRRLYAVNQELLVALKDIATTCSTAVGAGQYLTLSAIEKAARAAIAKAQGEQT